MAEIRSRARRALAAARGILRVHLRTLVPIGLTVLAGGLAILAITIGYAGLVGVAVYESLVESLGSFETWSATAAAILSPLVLLAILATLTWAGTVSQAASAALDRRRIGMPSAVGRSVTRAPRAVAVVILILAAALGSIIAAPVFLVVGLVRLIARRDRSERTIAMAIPFGVAVLVLVRWSLALAAVWLDGLTPRAALRESSRRVRGRGPATAITLLAAVGVTAGVSEGAALLVPDPGIQVAVRFAALVLVGGLPFVAQAVLYRRDQPATEQPAPPVSRRARVAAAVSISLVLPLIVAVTPGSAATATPGTTVTMTAPATESLTGQFVALSIDVTGTTPTGSVRIEALPSAGGTVDLGTQAIDAAGHLDAYVGETLPAGDYQLIAHYLGDAGNAAADSAPLDFTYRDRTANIAVTSTQGGGNTATVSVTLTAGPLSYGTPGGTVTLSAGATSWGPTAVDVSGVATIPVDLAGLGTRELLVRYNGDGSYVPGSTLYTVPRIPTVITVEGDAVRSIRYGAAQLFTGSVYTTTGTTPAGDVELWWNSTLIATATLTGAGRYSISSDELGVGSGPVLLHYAGDADHAPADDTSVTLDVVKETAAPTITYTPNPADIGDAVTLTATFADIGAGPTGSVTFTDSTGATLGSTPISSGAASISWSPIATVTYVTASHAGNANFAASSSSLQINSARGTVTVAITDPSPVAWGDRFLLVANVKVGAANIPAEHGVDFVTSTGTVLKGSVAVNPVSGNASVWFCAGAAAYGCQPTDVVLGSGDLDIVASYGESSVNLAADDTYEYRPSKPVTTTVLEVTPANVPYGSGVHLKATVTSPGFSPTGSVSFYGVDPDGSLAFIGNVPLTAGVAELDTQSGDGTGLGLRWPQNAVKAVYQPDGAFFQGSNAAETITLGRIGTSLAVTPVSPSVGVAVNVEVTVSHDPGASADYRGSVTIASDTGDTCTRYLSAPGQRAVSCPFTWATSGPHTVTASYTGDVVYLPVLATATPITVGTALGTPALAPVVPTSALAGEDVTVTWSSDPSMTGDIQVVADGSVWCTVAVATHTCTGRFGTTTSGLVDIHVVYPGDANWYGADEVRTIRVTRCVLLDVRGNDATLGSVRVDTAPNCGATGYLPGTIVSVTAQPIAPGEFGYWTGYRPPAPGLVLVDSAATTRWVVTADTQTWVRVAQFRMPCSPVSAHALGYGGISVYPASNCRTDAGAAGWLYGTPVTVYPDGHYDPVYDEPDAFWAFGTLPPGAVQGTDSAGRPLVRLTVTKATTIPVYFGPVCREPSILLDPADNADTVGYDLPHNCSSPTGGGYLRYTKVTAHVTPGDPAAAISGWSLDGVAAPELGTADDLTITIDPTMPAYVATTVHCYAVDVTIDGVADRFGEPAGEVRVDATDCPDGSDRYLGGTTVTLTPRVLVAGTVFNGWNETRIAPIAPGGAGTGDVTAAARVIEKLDRDVTIIAGFFDADSCSRLTDAGSPGLLTFQSTGCGPGYYFDARKQTAGLEGVDPETLTAAKTYSTISALVNRQGPLGVYVTIQGDTPDCTGAVDAEGFENLGLNTTGRLDCKAAGDVKVQADVCQPVVTDPVFTVKGRAGTYGADSMPRTFYLTGQDGMVQEVTGFAWGQAIPVRQTDIGYIATALSGPCGATGNLMPPDTDILLYAGAPSNGFSFTGWTDVDEGEATGDSPRLRTTTSTDAELHTGISYEVVCHTVTFAEGISIEGDAPYCPGSSPADNSFIAGTAIKVRAQYWLGDKSIEKFTSGVVGGQIYEDPANLDWVTYAYVDSDKKVAALWQNRTQRIGTEIAKSMKLVVAFTAVVAPVVLGMFFPPVGIFFAAMGTAAGIAGFIPGADKAAAVFDLLNPSKISACIARWGFTKPGSPGGQNIGAMISTGKTVGTAVFTSKDVLVQNIGALGIAGAAASIGYGLYDAGIGGVNMVGPQSVEELAGTSTLAGCMDQQWRILQTNMSGTNGVSGNSGAGAAP
ncbi:MAG: Ig-like domain repeat protein [Microbacteriaceae bacterium]